jgi:hypothetical protein
VETRNVVTAKTYPEAEVPGRKVYQWEGGGGAHVQGVDTAYLLVAPMMKTVFLEFMPSISVSS